MNKIIVSNVMHLRRHEVYDYDIVVVITLQNDVHSNTAYVFVVA